MGIRNAISGIGVVGGRPSVCLPFPDRIRLGRWYLILDRAVARDLAQPVAILLETAERNPGEPRRSIASTLQTVVATRHLAPGGRTQRDRGIDARPHSAPEHRQIGEPKATVDHLEESRKEPPRVTFSRGVPVVGGHT